MLTENIYGQEPIIVAQGASLTNADGDDLVEALNTIPNTHAESGAVLENIGFSKDHGHILAGQIVSLRKRTGKKVGLFGHSEAVIDILQALHEIEDNSKASDVGIKLSDVVDFVGFISGPLTQHNAFRPGLNVLMRLAHDADPHHKLTTDFYEPNVTALLRRPLPGANDGVTYAVFHSEDDNAVNYHATLHPSITIYREFTGRRHLHQLHNHHLIKEAVGFVQQVRRGNFS